MKIGIRKLAQPRIRISPRPLDLYCIHRTPASSPSPPRPHPPHTKPPRCTGATPDLSPTPDARAAPKGYRQHAVEPSAVCHRLSPHRPGILNDMFADTKTLWSPQQAFTNAMNHSKDTDARTQRRGVGRCASALCIHPCQYYQCSLRPANAPYGFGIPLIYTTSSFSLFPFAVTPPTLLMPPTARQRPFRILVHGPSRGSPRPRRVSLCRPSGRWMLLPVFDTCGARTVCPAAAGWSSLLASPASALGDTPSPRRGD